MLSERKYVSIQETASILSVSGATVRNWIKHDYLKPVGNSSKIVFIYDEVNNLKESIRAGRIRRLNQRANKANACKTFLPDEYLADGSYREAVESLVLHITGRKINVEKSFFIMCLRRLFQECMHGCEDPEGFIKSRFFLPHNRNLSDELVGWYEKLGRFRTDGEYGRLLNFELPPVEDILGLIYQSLLIVGYKSRFGSYYTPNRITRDIALSYPGARTIMDPCCGTGQFLMAFSQEIDSPENLIGYDIDELAVRIARINLMLRFKGNDFNPRIYTGNFFLDDIWRGGDDRLNVDLITTNPPWGLHCGKTARAYLAAAHPEIRSFESFSYVLKKSIDMLPPGGMLSFILPESILFVKAHADIRKYIIDTARIERIVHLGRIFKNVFTPVIRLDLRKDGGKSDPPGIMDGKSRRIDRKRFANNRNYVFDIHTCTHDDKILGKVFEMDHITLAGRAEWALGIVTGDNYKFLSKEKIDDGYELIYKGRDIGRYHFNKAGSYIKFIPDRFQQAAPEWKYRAAGKIVYRFISRNLICAYDDVGRLTLNSANLFIPHAGNYPAKAILALFNSLLYQFIFHKKFHSIKVLRTHLEQLPLPLWDDVVVGRLVLMADGILSRRGSPEEVDEFVMGHFDMNERERNHVRSSVRLRE